VRFLLASIQLQKRYGRGSTLPDPRLQPSRGQNKETQLSASGKKKNIFDIRSKKLYQKKFLAQH
jgi:hypothetical protein